MFLLFFSLGLISVSIIPRLEHVSVGAVLTTRLSACDWHLMQSRGEGGAHCTVHLLDVFTRFVLPECRVSQVLEKQVSTLFSFSPFCAPVASIRKSSAPAGTADTHIACRTNTQVMKLDTHSQRYLLNY